MSLGTWGLSLFGMFCGLTAAHQMAKDGFLNWLPVFPRFFKALPVKIIDSTGSFFGLVVASYTGVLLASTAVPVWARARHILGPLFLTSGLSSGFASLSLILSLGRRNEEPLELLERAELVAMSTEFGLISAVPAVLRPLANSLFNGKIGSLLQNGKYVRRLFLALMIW